MPWYIQSIVALVSIACVVIMIIEIRKYRARKKPSKTTPQRPPIVIGYKKDQR